jgi:serine/threonine-protein kinase RsbT
MPPQAVAEALDVGQPSARVRIPVDSEADVLLAVDHGRRLAASLDFSPADVTVISTAILEVARNVLRYARRGDLLLHTIQKRGRVGLAVVAQDKGPGIADVAQALRDGQGLGLASARRLMDEFRVRTSPGHGTTVTMRKWTRRRQARKNVATREMR